MFSLTDTLKPARKPIGAIVAGIIALALIAPAGCGKKEEPKPESAQQSAQTTSDPAKEHFDKGVQHTMKGELDLAIAEYEQTIKYNPNSAEAHSNLGFAYFDKGETDKAIASQTKAIELNPTIANAYYGMALALEKKGDKNGALKFWKEFAKLSQPHSKWWIKAQERIAELEKGPKKATKK